MRQHPSSLLVPAILIAKKNLIKSQNRIPGQKRCNVFQVVDYLQIASTLIRNQNRQKKRLFIICRDTLGNLYPPVRFDHSVNAYLIGQVNIVLQIQMIHIIMNQHLTCFLIIAENPCRSVYVFIFSQTGVGCSVRIYQSIHAEVPIMDFFPMISPIIINRFSIVGLSLIYGMVAPFPDKSPTQRIILVNQSKIVFQITGAISHRMAVFYQKQWFFRFLFHIGMNFRESRIHPAEHINI